MVALRAYASAAFALDTRSLAVFRMALGVLLCADALLRTRDFTLMFAADGMFPLAVLARYHPDVSMWSVAKLVDATWWGGLVLATEGVAGAALAFGVATRPATVIAWVALVSVIRRTAPATNAGDFWLATLLFWSIFLPLGAAWSFDAWRASGRRSWAGRAERILSAGSVALVLQIVAVYLGAGMSKWNASWFSGEAAASALSVHDHGTRIGEALASFPWVVRAITWGTLAMELVAPIVLLTVPRPGARMAIVALFTTFHLAICCTMTVGLFGPIGMAAWLAVIPGAAWEWLGLAAAERRPSGPPGWAGVACMACGVIAMISFVHDTTAWRSTPLPRPIATAVNALCLHQTWGMFGTVPRQHQWVYSRARTADGNVIDVLRGGRPVEDVRPTGGFLSLPHHRWHKLFWELPRPAQRIFAPSIAAALVNQWNGSHPPQERIESLEIRFARMGTAPGDDVLHDLLLGTWPPRDATGSGNLERRLRDPATGRID